MVTSAIAGTSIVPVSSRHQTSFSSLLSSRSLRKNVVSVLRGPYSDSSDIRFSSKKLGIPLKFNEYESGAHTNSRCSTDVVLKENKNTGTFSTLDLLTDFFDLDFRSYGVIVAKEGANPPIMPAVMTPVGALDLSTVLFRNRIIFIGQPVNSAVAQKVISQLVTLATIDENADILIYLNCPGGSTYSVLAIYDCMSWIKPKVGTVCFGAAASQGALLLAGGEKGMRYAMPNARIMIHQPQSGCGGHVEDVRLQVNEAVQSRQKVDKMYAAFTGQSIEMIQTYTERDRFMSSAEAMEFGLIDGVLETEY